MAIAGIDPKCYILALFVRDDGVRFLLGDDPYEFKDKQLHFQPNTVANDVVEVQGNDGYLLAGQVRRPGTQSFDGYVCNGTNSKAEVEVKRREFLQFFRRSHFYKVIYVFPNGTAIQRKQGFLVDDPTVQELYQQYPEYHVALNFEDVNYYTYEEDDQGQEIYAKEAIVPLAGGGATGGLIWDEYGVVWEDPWSDLVSVSGSEIQIDNEADARAPVQDLEIQGDTYQNGVPTPDAPITVQTVTGEQTVTVTGKNLFNVTSTTRTTTRQDVTVTIADDGMITLDGIAGGTIWPDLIWGINNNTVSHSKCKYYFPMLSNAVFSLKYVSGTASSGSVAIRFNDDGAKEANIPFSSMDTTRTVQNVNGINRAYVTGIGAGTTFDNFSFYVQVEEGTTATSFEPYESQSYIIDLRGKNLLNISDFEMGGLSNGNPTTSSYRIQNANHPIAVQPNTTYTLSVQLVSPVQGFRVGVYECDATGSFISNSGWKQLYVPNTFTTGPNTYCLKMVGSLSTTSTNVSTAGTENTTACTTVAEFMRGCTLMLEKGSTATTYEAYNPIELCKIGDYQDYIYKSGDDWYVHKETSKSNLWELNWASASEGDTTNGISFYVGPSGAPQHYRNIGLSNCFERLDYSSDHSLINFIMFSASAIIVNIARSKLLSADKTGFVAWLNNNLAVAYYPIATPTDTKITDATLVGQLEAPGAMKLFIGKNNVLVSATNPNLPATLAFDYYTKFATIGAEWEEGGTKGATIVDVNAIDNTYPVWELMGPAVNPTISVLTTNTTLTYNGTITASQKLVIDMFNKTATLNGTSVIGNVSGDFVYMAPGVNRIAYTAENNDAPDSTIYWQEVVG